MSTAINHCTLVRGMKDGEMTKEGFQEAVMERAGRMIAAAQNGKNSGRSHKFAGVELVATAVADRVIAKGAGRVAGGMGVDLELLMDHAAAIHISVC